MRGEQTLISYNLTLHTKAYYTRKGVDIKKKKTVVRKMNLRGKNSKWVYTIMHTLKYIPDQLKNQMWTWSHKNLEERMY